MEKIRNFAVSGAVTLFFIYLFIYPFDSFVEFDVLFSINSGKIICSDHKILHYDEFLYTIPYHPPFYWINDQWGFHVFMYIIYHIFGLAGIIIFKCALITCIFLVLYYINKRNGSALLLNLGILLLSYYAMKSRFMPRPQLLTDLFLSIFLLLFYRIEKNKKIEKNFSRVWWIFPCTMILWCNFYSGCFIGLAFLGTIILAEVTELFLAKTRIFKKYIITTAERTSIFSWIGIFVITTLAMLCNPSTYKIFTYLAVHFSRKTLLENIMEWSPPQVDWLIRPEGIFFLLETITFIILFFLRKLNIKSLFFFLTFFYPFLHYNRAISEYVIINSAIICLNIQILLSETKGMLKYLTLKRISITEKIDNLINWTRSTIITPIILVFLFLIGTVYTMSNKTWQTTFDKKIYPIEALDFLNRYHIRGNIYNTYQLGNFILFKDFPARKAFIHSFCSSYPDVILEDYIKIQIDSTERENLLKKYNVNIFFLAYPLNEKDISNSLITYLCRSPEWRLIYWDDTALIFLKNIGEFREILSQHGFYHINPIESYSDFIPPKEQLLLEAEELKRKIKQYPEHIKAYLLLGDRLMMMNEFTGAKYCYEKAKELDDKDFRVFLKLGVCYYKMQQIDQALENLLIAQRMNPKSPIIMFNLAIIYLSQKDTTRGLKYLRRSSAMGFEPSKRLLLQLTGNGRKR